MPAALLAGCGFHLRRSGGVPFASLYLDASPASTVAQRLRSLLVAGGDTRLTETPAEAEAVLKLARDERTKTILSLSGAGRVTEYRLTLKLQYSLIGREAQTLATESIELTRDFTYDDSQLLAKSAEEALLYRDLDDDAAQRILRRLQAITPVPGGSR